MQSDDFDEEAYREVEDWGGYEELGSFQIDLESDMPLCLDGTEMMLVAEKDETQNVQAIIIQSFGNSNYFKRIGWFILSEIVGTMTEQNCDDREFGDIRKVFKAGQRILV